MIDLCSWSNGSDKLITSTLFLSRVLMLFRESCLHQIDLSLLWDDPSGTYGVSSISVSW